MFMNDYSHKGGLRLRAVNYLSKLGLPCENIKNKELVKLRENRWASAKITYGIDDNGEPVTIFYTKIFNKPLKKLHYRYLQLKTTQRLPIPKIVQELCERILKDVETEGIFMKRGCRSKQLKIISSIEETGHFSDHNSNVIDVAAVLRYFLRTLPEPLIPYSYHNLFLACCNVQNKKEVLLIAVLLLPTVHLNLLTYLMQFFNEVTSYSVLNKMSTYNLAVCIAGDLMPVRNFFHGVFEKTTEVVRILIKTSYDIGVIRTDMKNKLEVEEITEYKKINVASFISEVKNLLFQDSKN